MLPCRQVKGTHNKKTMGNPPMEKPPMSPIPWPGWQALRPVTCVGKRSNGLGFGPVR